MVGVTDIPDWCFVELYGKDGMRSYSEAPTDTDLSQFYTSSPLAHVSKVLWLRNLFEEVARCKQRSCLMRPTVVDDFLQSGSLDSP